MAQKNQKTAEKKTEFEFPEVEHLKSANSLAIHRLILEEGVEDLNRPAWSLIWSGIAAGLAVSSSLLAEGVLAAHLPKDQNWTEVVTALGYAMGFILVILGKMQLFTETTIMAAVPFAVRPTMAVFKKAMRLWCLVLLANLIGTCVAALLITKGILVKPDDIDVIVGLASKITALNPWHVFLNAIPAGFLIAIIPWALPNSSGSGFWLILIVTWLIGAAGFSHSIVGSAEAFTLLFAGKTGLDFTFLGFIIPAVIGNLVGGACIFAIMAHGQVRHRYK